MVQKTLELTIISAKDLKNVNLIGKMDVYVVVSLSDDPKSKQKTHIHQDGGTHPSWNYTMRFIVDDQTCASPNKFLTFQLKHEYSLGADKDLGEVRVSMKELFDSLNGKDPNAPVFLTYQVRRSSGKAKGELKFSYKFVDMGYNKPIDQSSGSSSSGVGYAGPPPSGAYPPPDMAAHHPYPPPPVGYPGGYPGGPDNHAPPMGVPYAGPSGGYPGGPDKNHAPPMGVPYAGPPGGYPGGPDKNHAPPMGVPYAGPPGGYPPYGAYPPQPPPGGYGYGGYGYPPPGQAPPNGYPGYAQPGYPQAQQPQKPKKGNKFGMGLGAGLLGGALGGLVLGEMADDAFDGGDDFDF